ncbi:hypothetical protein BCR41DRAFT_376002 [Lobosporangium transversale]|uniref:Uncharacterized protein n=1 Tax=Lobosporangium transversale TaxID=64571 RepID=A0A1Y2G8Z6_9FUNG|nr:hypothetical protein BCR41DRAFT_376002 [Lobosporangium transversale]ORY93690.1 hypothetical protein BCR41DRAFT_376002 [Lobosporangium transversale]|eukprot:XP_021875185.1 hypothetical protein BCR41DRAFT_376002 [Lobosporangium transversale]
MGDKDHHAFYCSSHYLPVFIQLKLQQVLTTPEANKAVDTVSEKISRYMLRNSRITALVLQAVAPIHNNISAENLLSSSETLDEKFEGMIPGITDSGRARFIAHSDSEDEEKLEARKCEKHYKAHIGATQHDFRALQETAHGRKVGNISQNTVCPRPGNFQTRKNKFSLHNFPI